MKHPLNKRPFTPAKKLYETPGSDPYPYQLAFLDREFLLQDELRPVRLQLELLKPELAQKEHNIQKTIVVFGSNQIMDPDTASKQLKKIEKNLLEKPADPDLLQSHKKAQKALEKSHYYKESKKLAEIVTKTCKDNPEHPFFIITGGGGGIMEAANRGAFESGGKSVSMLIALPLEPFPNPYITPELTFEFHYFAIRKMHLLMRACAFVAFPGGYGTLDELFEVLTLMQTKKINQIPIILVGRNHWTTLINFPFLVDEGLISEEDSKLFTLVDTAEEAWNIISTFYQIPPLNI